MPRHGHLPYSTYFWLGLAGGAVGQTVILLFLFRVNPGDFLYFLTLILSLFSGGGGGLLVGWIVKENCTPFRNSDSWRFLHYCSGILAVIMGLIGWILILLCSVMLVFPRAGE
jgi:hypothetical protein